MVPPSCPGLKSQKNRMRCVDLKIMCSKNQDTSSISWGGFFKDPPKYSRHFHVFIWESSRSLLQCSLLWSIFDQKLALKLPGFYREIVLTWVQWIGLEQVKVVLKWRELAVPNPLAAQWRGCPSPSPLHQKALINLQRLILWAFSPPKKTEAFPDSHVVFSMRHAVAAWLFSRPIVGDGPVGDGSPCAWGWTRIDDACFKMTPGMACWWWNGEPLDFFEAKWSSDSRWWQFVGSALKIFSWKIRIDEWWCMTMYEGWSPKKCHPQFWVAPFFQTILSQASLTRGSQSFDSSKAVCASMHQNATVASIVNEDFCSKKKHGTGALLIYDP